LHWPPAVDRRRLGLVRVALPAELVEAIEHRLQIVILVWLVG
jgi:hypothetical protein